MISTTTPCSPEILLALEKAYGNGIPRPEASQVITNLVLPLCSHLPEITLVIDGFDECKQTELRLIWDGINRILKNVHAKVLISSEDQTNLHLKGFDRIRIDQQHNQADIDTYINEQISGLSGSDQLFGDENLRRNIKIKLQNKADGMLVLAQSKHALFTNEGRFLWIHLVLQIIQYECSSPHEVKEAVERLPPGLEAIYSRCLARKCADRLLCDINLLLWVCAAPEPFGVEALRELLATNLQNGQVSTEEMRTEAYLLQSGVGLVTLEIGRKLILPVHSTARDFVFSNSARRHFALMSTEADSNESWPLCINAKLWSERTFRSALGSLCLSQIELGTSLGVAMRPDPARILMPQPKIPKILRSLIPLKSSQRPAEITINPSTFRRPTRQMTAKVFLQYAIDNWLTCNRTIAPDGVVFPWMAQINRRTSLHTNQQLFEKVAKGRNDSFGVHPWPWQSLNSHLLSMFAYAVANDHVPLMRVVKKNRKSLPPDVFDRPLPEHGEMLAIHVATRKGFTGIINELLDICDVSRVCRSTGENVLHLSAKTGEINHFMTFREISTINADLQDKFGQTPLHLAAINGNESVVQVLLEKARVEVNVTDKDSQTPLHLAAINGNEEVVKMLLKTERVEVNVMDKDGRSPLHWAAINGSVAMVKMLLDTARVEVNCTAKVARTALHWATINGSEEVVKMLLKTARVEVNLRDIAGRTPLHLAAIDGNEAVMKMLLETARVEVNLRDEASWTPLHLAAYNNNQAMVKMLLETARVKVNLTDKDGQTPLYWAVINGSEAMVKMLLDTARVEVNLTDKVARTALHWAAINGSEGVVKMLLETARVEVNLRDIAGRTPLHLAAIDGNETMVKMLLENPRVQVNLKDKDGQTLLHWAAINGSEGVVKMLLKTARVEVNLRDKAGRTPLHLAAYNNNQAMVKMLLETARVEVNAAAIDGQTPLQLAAAKGYEVVVKILLETARVGDGYGAADLQQY